MNGMLFFPAIINENENVSNLSYDFCFIYLF